MIARVRVLLRGPFGVLVGIRLIYLLGAAAALAWAPPAVLPGHSVADTYPYDTAWGGLSDLVFGAFARWDSSWYLAIAHDGYSVAPQAPAFWPLTPAILHVGGLAVGSALVVGVVVSLVASGVGATLVARIGELRSSAAVGREGVLLLALYPVALILAAPYSEGLYLALSAGAILAAFRGRWRVVVLLAFLAVLDRVVGVALVVPLLLCAWPGAGGPRRLARLAAAVAGPVAAIAAFSVYLQRETGDSLAWLHQQERWFRDTHAVPVLASLWRALTAGLRGAWQLVAHAPSGGARGVGEVEQVSLTNVVLLGLMAGSLALAAVAWRRLGPALGSYAFAALLLPVAAPTHELPLFGLTRFVVVDFPLFLALASLLASRPRLRSVTVSSFAALGGVAAFLFSRSLGVG
jgi:hypothetical protein